MPTTVPAIMKVGAASNLPSSHDPPRYPMATAIAISMPTDPISTASAQALRSRRLPLTSPHAPPIARGSYHATAAVVKLGSLEFRVWSFEFGVWSSLKPETPNPKLDSKPSRRPAGGGNRRPMPERVRGRSRTGPLRDRLRPSRARLAPAGAASHAASCRTTPSVAMRSSRLQGVSLQASHQGCVRATFRGGHRNLIRRNQRGMQAAGRWR